MFPHKTALALLAAGAFALPAQAEIQTYKIDNAHSFANWEVRHLVARTSGTFHDVQGKVTLDTDNLAKSAVEASISVYSLNSSHLKRDIHLLTEEFLGARDYPEMKFVSTRLTPATPEKGTVTGNLTLHGVTRPMTLDYQILGLGKDPWGGMRVGFKATARINRTDFGIGKSAPNGPIGNEVDITLLIEGIRLGADGQPWSAPKPVEPAKVISFPAPAETAPAPTPLPAAAPAGKTEPPKESLQDQLKKELLKGLLN
ncbi:MAG: YceI family protein [Pseudomonadota bacterium]